MRTAVRRFAAVERPSSGAVARDFARALAKRSSLALWAASLAAIALLNCAREIGAHFSAPPWAPPELRLMGDLPGFVAVVACQWVCLTIALLVADEAVVRGTNRRTSYALAVLLACLVATVAQFLIRYPPGSDVIPYRAVEVLLWRLQESAGTFADQLLVCGLVTFLYANFQAARRASALRHAAQVGRLEATRHTFESRLQAMQARVEPQLLFNTLAQVRRLYEVDPPRAGRMLDDLIAYLRAALPHLRESSSTLAKEAALARAYLAIAGVRLGDRLSVDIRVPAAFAGARMPPMVLLPLIDHVLAHGLAPASEGSTIRVETTIGGGKLLLSIIDSGAGFVPNAGTGALKAMVERLHALYGDAADLRFERLPDRGTQAVLEIPYETTDGHPR